MAPTNHRGQRSSSAVPGFSFSLNVSEKVILALLSLIVSFTSGVFVGQAQLPTLPAINHQQPHSK